jgi:hypothetical protein
MSSRILIWDLLLKSPSTSFQTKKCDLKMQWTGFLQLIENIPGDSKVRDNPRLE